MADLAFELANGGGTVPFAITCGGCPVQAEGVLPDGLLFYFRARHRGVSLGVGQSVQGAIAGTVVPGSGCVAYLRLNVAAVAYPGSGFVPRPIGGGEYDRDRYITGSFDHAAVGPLIAWMLNLLDYTPHAWGAGDGLPATGGSDTQ